MLKKTILFLTTVLLLFFTSCSFLNLPESTGTVTLTLSNQASRQADDYENLYIDLSLKGDYEKSQTIAWTSGANVSFEQIRAGARVYIEAEAYRKEPGLEEKILLYKGTSETIKVRAGENPLSLSLKKIYSVYFDLNGGEGSFEEQRIVKGGKARKPASIPEKEGTEEYAFIFDDWYTVSSPSEDGGLILSENPFDFENTPITSDIVLYAKWLQKNYIFVTFDSRNGSTAAFDTQKIPEGNTAKAPKDEPEKEDDEDYAYIFNGWYTSTDEGKTLSEKPFDFENTPVTESIILYAGWKKSAYYKVSFNTMGGNDTFETQRVPTGYPANRPKENPEREGTEDIAYEFIGWFTSSDNGETLSSTPYDFTSPVTENITLYAKWEAKIATGIDVSVDDSNVNFEPINVTVNSGETASVKIFTADSGYDTYLWKVDGTASDTTTERFILNLDDYGYGIHNITLKATSGGKYYSYTTEIKKE